MLPLITVSKQSLKRVLLSLVFCLFSSSLYATEPITVHERFAPDQKHRIPLNLNASSYVTGEYQTSSRIKSIALVDENQTIIRKLGEPYMRENRFIFHTESAGAYAIVIETSQHEIVFTCKLDIAPVLSKQPDTPDEELISPTLQKMRGIKETNAFWEAIKQRGTPLIEARNEGDFILTFLYKGARSNVKIMGAPIGDIAVMQKMAENDIWYKSFIVPKGTRLSYQLAPDVPEIEGSPRDRRVAILSTLQHDPFNKTPMEYSKEEDKFHRISTVTLPPQSYTDGGEKKRYGSITSYTLNSHLLNNERDIDVYLPQGFSKEKHYPVLFLFDGKEYQSKVQTPIILDTLIAHQKIPPIVAVFISNPSAKSRASELPCNPLWADFMAKELLPWVKETITPHITPEWSILSGSSYGGLASAFTAFRYPQFFGNVLSFSGSFWWNEASDLEPEWLTREFARSQKRPLTFRLYAGKFETGQHSIDILESNRHLRTVLEAKGYDVSYEEFWGGHDYFSWQFSLMDGLIALLKTYPMP